ncbi:uncharacterized protein adm2b [Syngnathus acus]|uniref:uncharacterized protein adm2b n=1 Tax=Syngnathus acus TaxID=161584 RepID=UPI0018861CBD|nr:uncharacterized protein adm2b [Syngnathus acus]
MCALLQAWTCLVFALLPLEIQTRALFNQNLQTARHRSSKHMTPSSMMPPTPDYAPALDDAIALAERRFVWPVFITKKPPSKWFEVWPGAPGRSRGRRHTYARRARGQLMRAGCVLGTCQVQNLSHRLYQLIGRSGREDSSPINPRSPHSYG